MGQNLTQDRYRLFLTTTTCLVFSKLCKYRIITRPPANSSNMLACEYLFCMNRFTQPVPPDMAQDLQTVVNEIVILIVSFKYSCGKEIVCLCSCNLPPAASPPATAPPPGNSKTTYYDGVAKSPAVL